MHERERVRRAPPPGERGAPSRAVDPRVARILALQRGAGNQAVARMFWPPEYDTEEPQSWNLSSYLDPRQYLPTQLGGYTDRQARATQNHDPQFGRADFPKDAAWAFRLAFLVVDDANDKKRPDELTQDEYDRTATLLGTIWSGASGMVISPNLDPNAGGADPARKLKLVTETLKDIIEIARTVMGRQLLTELAQAAREFRVIIETNEFVEKPTGR